MVILYKLYGLFYAYVVKIIKGELLRRDELLFLFQCYLLLLVFLDAQNI